MLKETLTRWRQQSALKHAPTEPPAEQQSA
jgi:hypothetical protein